MLSCSCSSLKHCDILGQEWRNIAPPFEKFDLHCAFHAALDTVVWSIWDARNMGERPRNKLGCPDHNRGALRRGRDNVVEDIP